MNYDLDDVLRLMHAAPAFCLARPNPFLQFIATLETAATECKEVLDVYPHVRYEPLDFLYLSLQSLGTLNLELMEDLAGIGKGGAVWACWMAMLSPRPEYRSVLDRIHGRDTHYKWCADFAQSLIDGRVDPENAEHARLVNSIRNAIENLPQPKLDLRRVPVGEELELRRAQCASVLERYRQEGATAARVHALQLGLIENHRKLAIVDVPPEQFRVKGIMMPILQADITVEALQSTGELTVFQDADDLAEYDAALFAADGIPMSWQRYEGAPGVISPFTLAIDELEAGARGIDIPEYGNRVLAQLGIAPAFVVWRNPCFDFSVSDLDQA